MHPDPAEEQEAEASTPRRHIWEIALEIGSSAPESEWAKVPADLAENLDHYLYDAPRKEE